jgi:hypothetical protein
MNKLFFSVLSLFLLAFIGSNLTFAQTDSTTGKNILGDPLFNQNIRNPIYLSISNISFSSVDIVDNKIIVKGAFEIENKSDYESPDFHYSVFGVLRGLEKSTDFPDYSNSRSDVIKLDSKEKIKKDFSLELKNLLDFGSLLVNIRIESPTGEMFTNKSKEIPNSSINQNPQTLSDKKNIYSGINYYFNLNSEKFFINEGPTFYPEKEDLFLEITSTSSNDIIGEKKAKISIFSNTYFTAPVYTEEVSLFFDDETSGSKINSIKIPEELEPGVYPMKIELENDFSNYYIPIIYGRFIIGGEIIKITSLSFEENKTIKDFLITIQGTPLDLRNQNDYTSLNNFDIEIILKNKKDEIIISELYPNQNVLVNNEVNLSLKNPVQYKSVYQIVINAKNGDKIIHSYSKNIKHKEINIVLTLISSLILIILILTLSVIRKKMKVKGIIVLTIICFSFGAFDYSLAFVSPTPNKEIGFIVYPAGTHLDDDIVRMDDVLDRFGVNVIFENLDQCINSGTIFPVKVDVNYSLCGNVPPIPGEDGRPENYSGLTLWVPKKPADWYWETSHIKFGTTTGIYGDEVPSVEAISDPEDWEPYDIDALADIISLAQSNSGDYWDETVGDTLTSVNNRQIYAAVDYVRGFFDKYTTYTPSFSKVINGANNILSGSGTASYSLVAPQYPGVKDFWFYVTFSAKVGYNEGTQVRVHYLASIPVEICATNDACTLMPGVQYVDNEGVLRDENGNRMDDYTVQVRETTRTTYDHPVNSLIIKNYGSVWGGNTTPKNEFELVTVCNYCGGSNISDTNKPSSLYTFINSWVNVEKSMGGESLNTKLQRDDYSIFLGKINNYKRPQTIFSTFFYKLDDTWGPEQYFAREKNPTNFYNSDYINKNYLIADNTNGLKFYDLEVIEPHVNLYGINSFESLNPPFYSFSQIFSLIWNMNFREIYAPGSGTLTGEGFNSSNISLVKEKIVDSTGSGSSCSLYQDFCADKNGIQYLLTDNSQNYIELWNILSDNSRQLVGHTNVGDYSKNSVEALCTLVPNIGLNATCLPGPFDNATTTINTNVNFTITPSGGDNLLGYQYGWPTGTSTSNSIIQQYSATGTQTFSVPVQNGASTANAVCSIQVVDAPAPESLNVSCYPTSSVEAGNDVTFEVSVWNGTAPYTYDWGNGFSPNNTETFTTSIYNNSFTTEVGVIDSENRTATANCSVDLLSCGSAASLRDTAPLENDSNLCSDPWGYDWNGIYEITSGSEIIGWGWDCYDVSVSQHGHSCFAPKITGTGGGEPVIKIQPKIHPVCKMLFTPSITDDQMHCYVTYPDGQEFVFSSSSAPTLPKSVDQKGRYTSTCYSTATKNVADIVKISSDVCISNPTIIEQ